MLFYIFLFLKNINPSLIRGVGLISLILTFFVLIQIKSCNQNHIVEKETVIERQSATESEDVQELIDHRETLTQQVVQKEEITAKKVIVITEELKKKVAKIKHDQLEELDPEEERKRIGIAQADTMEQLYQELYG